MRRRAQEGIYSLQHDQFNMELYRELIDWPEGEAEPEIDTGNFLLQSQYSFVDMVLEVQSELRTADDRVEIEPTSSTEVKVLLDPVEDRTSEVVIQAVYYIKKADGGSFTESEISELRQAFDDPDIQEGVQGSKLGNIMRRRGNTMRRSAQEVDPAADMMFDELTTAEQAFALYIGIEEDASAMESIEENDMDGMVNITSEDASFTVFGVEDLRDWIDQEVYQMEESGELSEGDRDKLQGSLGEISILEQITGMPLGKELDGTMQFMGETWYFFN